MYIILVMQERATVTALVKSMGGIILNSGKTFAIYELPTEEKVLEFREKIPFLALWGGQGTIKNVPPIIVYFDKLI